MTVSDQEDFESHSEALQLPLFVAGMLDQSEHKQMEQHLKECPSCQKELEEEQRLRPAIHQALETWPSPSPRVLQRAKQKIAQNSLQETRETIREIDLSSGLLTRLEEWIRNLFLPRWVPGLAILIILLQGSFLQYLLMSPSTSVPPGMEGPIMVRELPPIVDGSRVQRVQIRFSPDLSLKAVQTLLKKVQGTIAQGPGPDGEFIITLAYNNPEQLGESLQTLKTTKAVQMVKPLQP